MGHFVWKGEALYYLVNCVSRSLAPRIGFPRANEGESVVRRLGLTFSWLTLFFAAPSRPLTAEGFVKGGLILDQHVGGIEDRWFAAVGGEWVVTRNGTLGFEIQSAYHRQTVGGKLDVRIVPLNIFCIGKLKSTAETVAPYAGAGIGLASAWTRTDFWRTSELIRTTEFKRDLGYQFMGGVELKRKVIIEFLVRYSHSSAIGVQAEPAGELTYALAAGVRW